MHWLQTSACIKELFVNFSKLFIPFICYFKLFHLCFYFIINQFFLTSYLTSCRRRMESFRVDTEWKSEYTLERSLLTYCLFKYLNHLSSASLFIHSQEQFIVHVYICHIFLISWDTQKSLHISLSNFRCIPQGKQDRPSGFDECLF